MTSYFVKYQSNGFKTNMKTLLFLFLSISFTFTTKGQAPYRLYSYNATYRSSPGYKNGDSITFIASTAHFESSNQRIAYWDLKYDASASLIIKESSREDLNGEVLFHYKCVDDYDSAKVAVTFAYKKFPEKPYKITIVPEGSLYDTP